MSGSILVADDDRSMLDLYSRLFDHHGYDYALAESIAEAAALLGERDFDLLVTDLMFPDGFGTELVKRFAEKYGGQQSILVTGCPPAPEALAAWPVSVCLPKPVDTGKLMHAVRKALA